MTLDELIKLKYMLTKLIMHLLKDFESLDAQDRLAVLETTKDLERVKNLINEMEPIRVEN